MWGYAVAAGVVLVTGYLYNEDTKKLRIGDVAQVPPGVLGLKNLPPGLQGFNMGSLTNGGANVSLLVTRRIPSPTGDTAEATVQTPAGPLVVTFPVRAVVTILRGNKPLPGGK